MKPADRLVLALDVSTADEALGWARRLRERVALFKVGLRLFTAEGPPLVSRIIGEIGPVFLDLKFHDIPNTVSKAAIAAARLGVYMFNLHTSGGLEMMKRCKDKVDEVCLKENLRRPKMIGVTVLTSLGSDALKNELCVQHGVKSQVRHLSTLAQKAGLDGVVASPQEISIIKNACGKDFLVVTPGIRPSWAPPDDQNRTATPQAAIKEGADYIVMGRGILKHEEPVRALELISLEILTA